MHDFLASKRLASLIKFFTRNEFEGFENLVNILGISKVFMKLLINCRGFDV